MNGVHDVGGMHGFGPIEREQNEPVFHAEWERQVLAMMRASLAQRHFHLDEMRWGIEQMPPHRYLAASYYERWLYSLEWNLIEKGLITPEEIAEKLAFYAEHPQAELPRRENPALVERLLETIKPAPPRERPAGPRPRFRVGERVRVRNLHPVGHTRLPRYVRGKQGVIERVDDAFIFPDANAMGRGRQKQPVYSVGFEGRELWGEAAEPRSTLTIDLWEAYLQPAHEAESGQGER